MRKSALTFLMGLSVLAAFLSGLWLIAVLMFIIGTGGTYSMTFEDGSIACGIPIFTEENWLLVSLQLFGIPALILGLAILLMRYCSGRLAIASLR